MTRSGYSWGFGMQAICRNRCKTSRALFGSPLRCSRVLSGMNAPYYRAEAKRCQETAAQARDPATKEYWLNSERCWLKLANQAELVAAKPPKSPDLRPDKKP